MDWHEIESLARVVVKVYLNDNAKIPDSVKVSAGLPPKGRSWTMPCYVLKKKNITEPQDEEASVTQGPLHPVPPQSPRWFGPEPPADSEETADGSNVGSAMHVDGAWPSSWKEQLASRDEVFAVDRQLMENVTSTEMNQDKSVQAEFVLKAPNNSPNARSMNMAATQNADLPPAPKIRSVNYGPKPPEDPLIAVVPSLLREVLNFFTTSPSPVFLNCLSYLYLNHDTIIPDYVNDRRLLVHLAFSLFPQIGGHSL